MWADCLVCFRCSCGATEWLISSNKYIASIVSGVNSLKNAQKCIDKYVNTGYIYNEDRKGCRTHHWKVGWETLDNRREQKHGKGDYSPKGARKGDKAL